MQTLFVILFLISLVLLIIGFFSPKTSLFWDKKERTKKRSSLIYGLIFVASIILVNITKAPSNQNSPKGKEEITKTKEWKEVYTFSGNGMKKSPGFELSGGEAKLKYKYQSTSPNIGVFTAYVVEEGKDIMKEGGIPDVMTSSTKEESETSLQKGAGRYYLHINAAGEWTVTVEELK
jgi:hypothetical protein